MITLGSILNAPFTAFSSIYFNCFRKKQATCASACRLQKSQIQQFSPSDTSQWYSAQLVVPVRHVLNKVALSKIAFPNPSQLHIYYHRPIFQMQINVFTQKRFSTVQTKILHMSRPPLEFPVSYRAPTLLANGQFFSFKENVKLDVLAFTLVFPRILTMLQTREPPVTCALNTVSQKRF